MTDPVRSFYRSNLPNLDGITDPSRRHYRILLPRGTFFKIPDRIRSPATLRTWLVRYRPSDVYYSASCWLAPERLGQREKTPFSDNIFLGSDIVFDIDRAPFSPASLELARQDALRLVAFCDANNLPVRYIAFSGSKGFHVICSDTVRYPSPDPGEREAMAKERRRTILARVLDEGIAVDPKITPDTRRIIRVPGTINSKTGYVCTMLSREELDRPIREILKWVPRVQTCTPSIPATGDESSLRGFRIISWLRHRFGVRSEPPPKISYATFLSSAVPGIDRQVPIFTWPARRSLRKIEAELASIQEQYRLSDIFLWRSEGEVAALSLATFPLRRLEKIVGASTSTGQGTLLRYHQLYFRVGTTCGTDGRVLAGSPVYYKTLHATRENNGRWISRPHYRFLADFLPLPDYPRMHGTGEVFFTHSVIEDE